MHHTATAAIILFFTLIDQARGGWREAIAGFASINDQYPFIPRFDEFVTREAEDFQDNTVQNCNAFQLRNCLMHHNNFKLLNDGTEDDDVRFVQSCKISAYVRSCFAAAQCSTVESLWRIGLNQQQAAMIINAARIEQIRCDDLRFRTNYKCITGIFKEARKDFKECAAGFEKLSWLKESPGKACKAVKYYDSCIQQIVRDQCGAGAGDSICLIVEAAIRELRFKENCDLNCSSSQNNIVGFMQSILPDYQQFLPENCSDGKCGHCELDTFKKCSQAFKKELGIKGECVFSFLDELKGIMIKKGKKGFEAVCNAGKQFKRCGDEKVCGCFNVDILQKQMNMTAAEAWALNLTLFTLGYQCTHEEFDDNFDCLLETYTHKKELLSKCEKRFREELRKPGHGIPCKAGQQYMDCVSSPFKRLCGLKAAKAVCNLELALLHQYGPHMRMCPFHCDI